MGVEVDGEVVTNRRRVVESNHQSWGLKVIYIVSGKYLKGED